MTIDPETLAAYADGELTGEEAERVATAIAQDPALADQVAAHRALRAQLAAHFAPQLDAPVPDRLIALLGAQAEAPAPDAVPDNVVDLAARRAARAAPRRAPPRWAMGGALAASLVLGLLIGGRIAPTGPLAQRDGNLVAAGALDTALTGQLASATTDGDVRILLSFKARGGDYCRGFEQGRNAGIACRAGGDWRIMRLQSGAETTRGPGYAQAGSGAAEIMAAAQDMAADGALDATAERAARDTGWTR